VSSEREALVDVNRERDKVARLLEGKAAEADALLDQLNQCSREKRFVCVALFLYSDRYCYVAVCVLIMMLLCTYRDVSVIISVIW
jgi:hypothetical protein